MSANASAGRAESGLPGIGPVLTFGHGGSADGYYSWVLVNRETHLGVVVPAALEGN